MQAKMTILMLTGVAAILSLAAPASATPPPPVAIDLLTETNVRIDGGLAGHSAGFSVAGLGNLNDDQFADVGVGATEVDNNSRPNSGTAYAVFGLEGEATIDLFSLGAQGFRADGAARDDRAGWSVASAGDVNGDGLDDMIVGTPSALSQGGERTGAAFVIFSPQAAHPIDLARIGQQGHEGFRIDGPAPDSGAGRSVAGAGYVNDDEYADVIVGVPEERNVGGLAAGAAHVVYGKPTTNPVDLVSPGDQAYRISAAAADDSAGTSVAGVGDMNGDGHDDVVVGAYRAEPSSARTDSGAAYVVWGKSTPEPVSLGSLDDQGFPIIGKTSNDYAGFSVADAGDVDGNGRDDVVVGAYNADRSGRGVPGAAYVVYDHSDARAVDLAGLGGEGFEIDGAVAGDQAGWSVAGTGDVNGGGRADVVIGSPLADNNGRLDSGSAHVVFGESPPQIVDLGDPGYQAFRIDGAAQGNRAGLSVAGAGNVNGDARPDVIVGAPLADHNGTDSGSAYIVYGPNELIEPACDADANRLGVFDFAYATPDSPYGYAASGISTSATLCGSSAVRAASYDEGGAGSQVTRLDIRMPPGVAVNGGDAMADGAYAGAVSVNLLTWSGDPGAPLFLPNVTLVLTVERDAGTECPADAIVCYRGDTTDSSTFDFRSWLWVTRSDSGIYTLTLGEPYSYSFPQSPAGYTKIDPLRLCEFAGVPGATSCGDDSQPWLMRNGFPNPTYGCAIDPSLCVDPPGGCASGRYMSVATATDRSGRATDPAVACIGWEHRPNPPGDSRGAPERPKRPAGGRRPPKPS